MPVVLLPYPLSRTEMFFRLDADWNSPALQVKSRVILPGKSDTRHCRAWTGLPNTKSTLLKDEPRTRDR